MKTSRHITTTLVCLAASLASGTSQTTEPTVDPSPSYYSTGPQTRDGIGKYYMGREIARAIGGHGAIQWLERPEREQEESPDEVVANLELNPGDHVADIGSGSGYFTFRIAEKIPDGKIYAVDIDQPMLDFIADRAEERQMKNITPHMGTLTDTRLPENSIDLVLIVDAYHEFSHPREMMSSIVKALKPGGRLVQLEYRKEDISIPIKPLHKMSQKQVVKELDAVGLEHVETRDFLDLQHFMIFRKPDTPKHSENSEATSSPPSSK
ncbi:MAG: class I SAM-dependent methyltransferase [Verrucomicrobiota bacterium]